MAKVARTCQNPACRRSMLVEESATARGDGKYCSRSCKGLHAGSNAQRLRDMHARLDALMLSCREDGHKLVYADLVKLRGPA